MYVHELGHYHNQRPCFVACSVPNHYLKQNWVNCNRIHMKNFPRKLNWNAKICFQEKSYIYFMSTKIWPTWQKFQEVRCYKCISSNQFNTPKILLPFTEPNFLFPYSLIPGRCVISWCILQIEIFSTSCEIAPRLHTTKSHWYICIRGAGLSMFRSTKGFCWSSCLSFYCKYCNKTICMYT